MSKAANNPISKTSGRLLAGIAIALALGSPVAFGQSRGSDYLRNALYDGPELEQYQPVPEEETLSEPRLSDPGESVVLPEGDWTTGQFSSANDESLFLEEPAVTLSSGTWLRRGCWYTQQEFVMWIKSDPRRVLIAVDQVQLGEFREGVITDAASFTYQPGVRMTIGRHIGRDSSNRDHAVEFTFTGLFDWESQFSLDAINPGALGPGQFGTLRTTLGGGDGAAPGFVSLDSVFYTYDASLNSYELNFVTRERAKRDQLVLRPDGSWVRQASTSTQRNYTFGLRVLNLNEHFTFGGQGDFDSNGVPQPHSGLYQVKTHNDLFGLQGGAEMVFQHASWQWGVRAKTGLLVNLVDRKSRVDTLIDGAASAEAEDIEKESLAALVEGGLFFHYYLRPNLIFRCSYDVLYLQGLALAPEQLGLGELAFPDLNIVGDSIFQGGFVGFEADW